MIKDLEFHEYKLQDCINEYLQIEGINLKSYVIRKKQLKLMIKRHKDIIQNILDAQIKELTK